MLRLRNLRAAEVDLAKQSIFATAGAGAPTATTGVGITGTGSTYVDTTTGKQYSNTGTIAAPTWTIVGTQT